jgi:hypothetical protein
MIDNLAAIMTTITALVAVGITFAIARRIFTGQLTPLDIKHLIEQQEEQIAELRRQNEMLKGERDHDRVQLREALTEATKAIFAITTWLTRYEDKGGFAVALKPARPERPPSAE